MLSPQNNLQNEVLQECSFEDEYLDDIKPELISFTLSGSNSSLEDCDRCCINTLNNSEEETPSNSLLITLSSNSSSDTLVTHDELALCSNQEPTLEDVAINRTNGTAVENPDPFVELREFEQMPELEKKNTRSKINEIPNLPVAKSRLSLSMHDVSTLPDFPLKSKYRCQNVSSDAFQSQSMTTLSSGHKSRDSGLPRSLSCLSLNCGNKNYDHVQSKVKEYIKHIKDGEERRKALKCENNAKRQGSSDSLKHLSNDFLEESKQSLASLVNVLQNELKERDIVLSKLQSNYDNLLIKYAEAENRIDNLRFKVLDPSVESPQNLNIRESNHTVDCASGGHYNFSFNSFKQYTVPRNQTFGSDNLPKSFINIENAHNCFEEVNSLKETSNEIYTQPTVCIEEHEKDFRYPSVNHTVVKTSDELDMSSSCETEISEKRESLSPVVRFYSSSSRLDRKMEPLSQSLKLNFYEQQDPTSGKSHNGAFENKLEDDNIYNDNVPKINSDTHKRNDFSGMGCKTTKTIHRRHRNCQLLNVAIPNKNKIAFNTEDLVLDKSEIQNGDGLQESILKTNSFRHLNTRMKETRQKEALQPLKQKTTSRGSPQCCTSKEVNGSSYKMTPPNGRDSGCPGSDLCCVSVQPIVHRFFTSQTAKTNNNELVEIIDVSHIDMQQKLLLNSSQFPFASSPCTNVNSYFCSTPKLNSSEVQMDESSYYDRNTWKEVSAVSSPLSINTCECWRLDESEDKSTESINDATANTCDTLSNEAVEEFNVPRLKLGSLLDDDGSYISQSMDSIDMSRVSASESVPVTSCDEGTNSSHEGTSDDVTYPSNTFETSSHSDNTTLNNKHCKNRINPSLKKLSFHSDESSKRYSRHVSINDRYALKKSIYRGNKSRHTERRACQDDSLQPSLGTSTSYRSIQSYAINSGNHSRIVSPDKKLDFSLHSLTTSTSYQNIEPQKGTSSQLSPPKNQEEISESLIQSESTSTSYNNIVKHQSIQANSNSMNKSAYAHKTHIEKCKYIKPPAETSSSTSYKTIKSCEKLIQKFTSKLAAEVNVKTPSTENELNFKPKQNVTPLVTTSVPGKSSSSVQCNKHQSDNSKKNLLEIVLRLLLIHFLSTTEKCSRPSCICNKSVSRKSVVNTETQTDESSVKGFVEVTLGAVSNIKDMSDPAINFLLSGAAGCSSEVENEVKECAEKSTSRVLANEGKMDNKEEEYVFSEGLSQRQSKSKELKNGIKKSIGHEIERVLAELPVDQEHHILKKCLEEMDNIAQQLTNSSQTILDILAVHKNHSS